MFTYIFEILELCSGYISITGHKICLIYQDMFFVSPVKQHEPHPIASIRGTQPLEAKKHHGERYG